MSDPISLALVAMLALVAVLTVAGKLRTERQRQVAWRKTKCFFGFHAAGPIRDEPWNAIVQRCEYCDQVLHEFQKDNEGRITRLY